jgi:hypothetical protein
MRASGMTWTPSCPSPEVLALFSFLDSFQALGNTTDG